MFRYSIWGLILCVALIANAQTFYPVVSWNMAPISEPANLGELKTRLKDYHDCVLLRKMPPTVTQAA